jgi:polyvinyl alcohol dehydrogenase (cytochrome)
MRLILDLRSPEAVVAALTTGPMRPMAIGLSLEDKREIALFLTGINFGSEPSPDANRCTASVSSTDEGTSDWPSWGRDALNTLHQPHPGIAPDDVGSLRLQWAFAYPGGAAPAEPIAVGGRLFLASASGLFALDAARGCTLWFSAAGAGAKMVTAGVAGDGAARLRLFFGDANARVSAVDAADGRVLWTSRADAHPNARVTGPVAFFRDRIYVPVSSMEDPLSYDPTYACCSFRGSVVAFDARTGRQLWKSFTIRKAPRPLHRRTSAGVEMYGPAGGAVYAPLAIDGTRNLLFASTAESYLRERSPGTNASVAFDVRSGRQRWSVQPVPKDNAAHCANQDEDDGCSSLASPLFEFAAPPVLARLPRGRDVLLAGQKSGALYGLSPATGRIRWETRLGEGGSLGGIEHGFAVEDGVAYVPISDSEVKPPHQPGGLAAVDVTTGKILWRVEARRPVCSWGTQDCSAAQLASAASIPGIVFSGSWDGHMRAYRKTDGSVAWDFDTAQTFEATNAVKARGGAVSGYDVIVANGWVYVTSGANSIKRPGNVLLAFRVESRR